LAELKQEILAVLFSLENVRFQGSNPVQKKFSVQMIKLVLKDDGFEAVGFDFYQPAAPVFPVDFHRCGAHDISRVMRNT
jgi:hypothetical protein